VHIRPIRSHKNACAGAATANAAAGAAITTPAFIDRATESLLFSLTFRRTFEGSSCSRTSVTRSKSYSQIRSSDFTFLDQRGTIQRFAAALPFIFNVALPFVAALALPSLLHSPQNIRKTSAKQFKNNSKTIH
jgi:hypothetical protein